MRLKQVVTRGIATVVLGAGAISMAALAAPDIAHASTTHSGTRSGPVASAPIMVGHSNKPLKGNSSGDPTAYCPNESPGAICTVEWQQSQGNYSSQFCYFQNNTYMCLAPYDGNCPYATCTFQQSGGGGNPPAIPYSWSVVGPNVSIISITG